MSDTKKSMYCGHCGKPSIFEIPGEGNKDGAKIDYNYHDGQDITTWRILECQRCTHAMRNELREAEKMACQAV